MRERDMKRLADDCKGMFSPSLQEYVLSHTEMPSSLQGALEAIKKHEDFLTTMEASEEKINGVVDSGRRLVSDGNANTDKIQEKADSIEER